MRYDIEGQVAGAEPDTVTWRCPDCPRVVVDHGADQRVTERMCAGNPMTGAPHGPVTMVRNPPTARFAVTRADLARLMDVPILDWQWATWERAERYCPSCGPMVEVDNPLRREIRHRRGCPHGAGSSS